MQQQRAFFARPQRFALVRRVRSVVVTCVNVHGGSQMYVPATLIRMRSLVRFQLAPRPLAALLRRPPGMTMPPHATRGGEGVRGEASCVCHGRADGYWCSSGLRQEANDEVTASRACERYVYDDDGNPLTSTFTPTFCGPGGRERARTARSSVGVERLLHTPAGKPQWGGPAEAGSAVTFRRSSLLGR
jgi:hypothetical protein